MLSLERIERAKDHFELFGIAPSFDIDERALQKSVNELSRLTHPDLAGHDPEAQLRALELSAKVNEAHRTLADPEARANYLLELLGGATKEQDKSLPDEFLMEMMEVREALADAQMSDDPKELDRFERETRDRQKLQLEQIATLFRKALDADGLEKRREVLTQVRLELNCLRYVQRMLEQIRPGDRPML